MQSGFSLPQRIALLAILVLGFPSGPVLAQSGADPPPTLKHFGSSLKRLKWDPDKKAAVESGSAEKSNKSASAEDVVKVDIDLVVCDVLVLDGQRKIVQNLIQDDFIIVEDEKPQQVAHFSAADDLNIERSIVLVFDYSSSVYPYISNSAEAAKVLVDQLRPMDRMAIVTDDVDLMVDYTRDKMKLKKALEELKQRATSQQRFGNSDQFSALMATARELFSKEDYRRVVIFQTDGDELYLLQPADLYRYYGIDPPPVNGSELEKRRAQSELQNYLKYGRPVTKSFSLKDLHSAVEKSRATVYSVIPGIRFMGLSLVEQMEAAKKMLDYWQAVLPQGHKYQTKIRAQALDGIMRNRDHLVSQQAAVDGAATKSGGFTSFLESPNQAAEIYARILADMNSRYMIAYYPSNKSHDGQRRKVSIAVRNHPEYTVEGRKTYYAPQPEQ